MRSLKILFVLGAASALAFLSTGCTANPEQSSVPWSRPADWEGQAPGFGR
jgi:hypothetical protein